MKADRTNKKLGWLAYQTSRDRLLDLFPGGWPAAMAWAEVVAAQTGDERFHEVAREYHQLGLRQRSLASLQNLSTHAGLEPSEFISAVTGYAMAYGADVSPVLDAIIGGPARLEALIALSLEPGGQAIRRRFLVASGYL